MRDPDPADWLWLHVCGERVAVAPDAYAEIVSIVDQVSDRNRGKVRHAHLVMHTAALLEQRGWLRFDIKSSPPGEASDWVAVVLVPPQERAEPVEQPPKRARRKRAATVEPPSLVLVQGGASD